MPASSPLYATRVRLFSRPSLPRIIIRRMSYNLLAGGYRDNYAYLTFESTSAKLKVGKISPGVKNGTWIEPSATKSNGPASVLYSLSEDSNTGAAVSLELKGEAVSVTSKRETRGGPAHGESKLLKLS